MNFRVHLPVDMYYSKIEVDVIVDIVSVRCKTYLTFMARCSTVLVNFTYLNNTKINHSAIIALALHR